MNDLPARSLSFKRAMFEAAVEGRKRLTSRVLVPQPPDHLADITPHMSSILGEAEWRDDNDGSLFIAKCRYGPVGTPLYLQEPFRVVTRRAPTRIDPELAMVEWKWDGSCLWLPVPDTHLEKPSSQPRDSFLAGRFMPPWAARYGSVNEGVEVSPLQRMSYEDWRVDFCPTLHEQSQALATFVGAQFQREHSERLWDSINAKRGYPWADDPWVFRIRFATPTLAMAAEENRDA